MNNTLVGNRCKRILSFALAVSLLSTIVWASPVAVLAATEDAAYFQELSKLVSDNPTDNYIDTMVLTIGDKQMSINGEPVDIDPGRDTTPMIQDGRTVLPIRAVVEAIGANVTYEPSTKTVQIKSDERTVALQIGSTSIVVDGKNETIDVAPFVQNERTMMPLRAVSENFGLDVKWDEKTSQIILSKPYQSKRIIVKTTDGARLSGYKETQSITSPDNMCIMQFDTEDDTQAAIAAIGKLSNVTFVQPDQVVTVDATPNSWGVTQTAADKYVAMLTANKVANKTLVAVLDSGADTTHPYLQGHLVPGYDFVKGTTAMSDGHGHGTHVSGTIIDTASSFVQIMPVRVMDSNGSGQNTIICEGIKYAARNNASVINLSIGGYRANGIDLALEDAIAYALARNVVVVVAAGNEHMDTKNFAPAYITGAITVAANDKNNATASFSNYGNAVDVSAPGVSILSAVPGGQFASWSGTSMATPHVSGIAALLKANSPSLTPPQVETMIKTNAIDKGASGWDAYYGSGLLSVSRLIGNTTTPVASIALDKATTSLAVGQTATLNATVAPTNATNKSVTWSSSNGAIATVSQAGLVTGVAAGTATITVKTTDGSKTATCVVTVTSTAKAVTSVTLNKTTASVILGQTTTLTPTITPTDATNKNVTWATSNAAIATVSQTGVVTGVAAGTATLTVKTADGSKTATCLVTVTSTAKAVTGITLDKSTIALGTSQGELLTATIAPSDATNTTYTWSSSNPNVASVYAGMVSAVSAGTATITVKTADGNKTATCAVTVTTTDRLLTYRWSETALTMDKGQTKNIQLNAIYESGKTKDITSAGSLYTNQPTVVTVDQNGKLTALGEGTAYISFQNAVATVGIPQPLKVTVTQPQDKLVKLDWSQSPITLTEGKNAYVQVIATYQSGKTKDVTAESGLYSLDTSVATVTSSGKIYGVRPGNATLFISSTAESGVTLPQMLNVTVTADGLIKLEINPATTTTNYTVGSSLNPQAGTIGIIETYSSGMKVTSGYRTNDFSCSPTVLSTVGPQTITVTHLATGVSATFVVNVTSN